LPSVDPAAGRRSKVHGYFYCEGFVMTNNDLSENATIDNSNRVDGPRSNSSAARVRALRERRRAAGKRLISVYLTQEEFDKLQALAMHFGWPVGATVSAAIRNCWARFVAAKSNLPR
jgi:hypothetical protein